MRAFGRTFSLGVPAIVVAAALGILASPAAAWPGGPPSPGAADIGDPLFPGLGNGGYDVKHYTLDLQYTSTAPVQTIPALVTIEARATQSLSRFNLDFSGDSVDFVKVDGAPATFVRDGEELVITPARPIEKGKKFDVRVGYTSGPREISPEDAMDLNKVVATAWFATPSGSITAAQPNGAHRIFPNNDVPSDPASYTFHALTPKGSTFVANGELTDASTGQDRTLWTYEMREPMAAELIQLAFGALTVRTRAAERGVRLRDVAATSQIDALDAALARAHAHLDWMIDKVGRYPFRTYGSLASDAAFPFALEDQTISLYPSFLFFPAPDTPLGDPRFYEPIMVHELAHQWYGDSVLPARWSDLWLNEGHATWYEWEWAQEEGDPAFYLEGGSFEAAMRAAYARGDILRAMFGPVAAPLHGADDIASLFSPNVYEGGAVVLFALRQVVGDPAFREIERKWAQRYGGGAATTADFIAFASKISGRDLTAFLTAWLYGTTTPPMPGHPDWTVDPVSVPTAAAQSRGTTSRAFNGAFRR
jgi:aminopeptidase N